jgi:hypothetical protein
MVRLYVDQTLRDRQPAPVQTPGSPLGRGPAAPGS